MTEASNQGDDALLVAKASASSADHKRQMFGHDRAGHARGLCRVQAPVADYQSQDRSSLLPARAGFLSIGAHLPVNWPGLRVRSLYARCAGSNRARDLSAIGSGSRPAVGNTSAHHQSVNAFGDVPHVQVLSSPLFSSGIDPNEIGLTEWETKSCSRSKRK